MATATHCSDPPRGVLIRLIGEEGEALVEDPRRLEALLRDYCPSHRREIVAIVQAAKAKAPAEIRSLSKQVPSRVLVARLARQLHDQVGLAEPLAIWALQSWCVALGVAVEADLAEEPPASSAETISPAHLPTSTTDPVATDRAAQFSALAEHTRQAIDRARHAATLDEGWNWAEDAYRAAQSAKQLGADPATSRALVGSATNLLAQAAWKLARREHAAGRLGKALTYLDRILAVSPSQPAASQLRNQIVTQRQQRLAQAQKTWNAGKPASAITQLEQLLAAFRDDAELAATLSDKRRAAQRVKQLVHQEIPELKRQNQLMALAGRLDEVESLAPVPGIGELRALIDSRRQAAAAALAQGRAELAAGNYAFAINHCERALAAVADHPQAGSLREQASLAAQQTATQFEQFRTAIATGRLADAHALERELSAVAGHSVVTATLRRQLQDKLAQLAGYWRFVIAGWAGAVLWWLAGWLAARAERAFADIWPTVLTSWLGYEAVAARTCFAQLLFAAFLLGCGIAALMGRMGWSSLALLAGIAGAGVLPVAAVQQLPTTSSLPTTLAYGAWYGIFVAGGLLYLPHGYRGSFPAAVVAGCAVVWLVRTWAAARGGDPLVHLAVMAVNISAALAVLGLVQTWWRFGLMPVGVLLAYALAQAMQGAGWSSWSIAAMATLIFSVSILALGGRQLTGMRVGVTAGLIGVVCLASQAALDSLTAPAPMTLLAIWAAIWWVAALWLGQRLAPDLGGAGLRYAWDTGRTWARRPRQSLSTSTSTETQT